MPLHHVRPLKPRAPFESYRRARCRAASHGEAPISPASSSPAPGATVVTVGEACICGNREGPAERVRAPCGLLEDQGGALQRERTVCLARALSRLAGLIQV